MRARALFTVALGLVSLTGCVGAGGGPVDLTPWYDDWRFEQRVDRFTGETAHFAWAAEHVIYRNGQRALQPGWLSVACVLGEFEVALIPAVMLADGPVVAAEFRGANGAISEARLTADRAREAYAADPETTARILHDLQAAPATSEIALRAPRAYQGFYTAYFGLKGARGALEAVRRACE